MLLVDLGSVTLQVFTHRPERLARGLLLVFHGNSRNAADYRDFAVSFADQYGLLVFAPLFDGARYPPNAYHRGNITNGRGSITPEADRTTRLVRPLIDWAQSNAEATLPYWLWGFSAGGQFLSRVAAFEDVGHAQRIVIASPSSHVLPVLGSKPRGERAPYGLGGVFTGHEGRAAQQRYLAQPITLYVGADDAEPDDPTLARSRPARRQGEDRVARSCETFDLAASIALENEWNFGWRLMIEPKIGHSVSSLLEPHRAFHMLDLANTLEGERPETMVQNRRRSFVADIGGRLRRLRNKT